MRFFKVFFLFFNVFAMNNLNSQVEIHVDRYINTEEMITDFFNDSSYQISNVKFTGDRKTQGYFEAASTDLGINAGIVLSTDQVFSLIPPTDPDVTIQVPIDGSSDPDLQTLFAGVEIMDASVLEFDIMPFTNMEIELYYKFGSDEYNLSKDPDFDVFGIFVDGPGFDGYTNIALLPDGTTPVSINSINADSNSTYYINYVEEGGEACTLDGMTTLLTSSFSAIANEIYTIKIAIADNADDRDDSAIFLDVSSFIGNDKVSPIANFDFKFLANKVHVTQLSKYETSYKIDFGNGDIFSNEIPTTYDYPSTGKYDITLIAENYWFTDTFKSEIIIETLNYDSLTSNLYIDNEIGVNEMLMDFFDSPNISLSNISHKGSVEAIGYFEGALTDLGIPAGIILSTGRVAESRLGEENIESSTSFHLDGDPDFDNYANQISADASIIEFDLVSNKNDSLLFSYVFGSEEYNQYVGWDYNDQFAFFIKGGKYEEFTNIATIGDTNIPVQINSINLGNNNELYRNYALENGTHIEYDGLTVVLYASFVAEKNVKYHLKIGVVDVGDDILDSAVFLGVESLNGDSLVIPPAKMQVRLENDEVQVINDARYATSYLWDFGDGTTSLMKKPTAHYYQEVGYYDLTLKTSNYCCSDSFKITIPVGKIQQDTLLCAGEDVFYFDQLLPELNQVGEWSTIIGTGTIENSNLSKTRITNLSVGTNIVEWKITDTLNNIVVFQDSIIIEVDNIYPLEIVVDDVSTCLTDDKISLIGFPEGGQFSGQGVTGNIFNPIEAGIGSHLIEYVYTSLKGCTSEITTVLEVNPAPIVDFTIPKVTICDNDMEINLVGIPNDGIFAGTGVIENIFDPAIAGLGNHEISYTVTNDFGCSSSSNAEVEVVAATQLVFHLDSAICSNNPDFELIANPKGGIFLLSEDTISSISPTELGVGLFEITYHYTDENGCFSSSSQNFEINLPPLQPEIIPTIKDSLESSITGDNYYWYLDGILLSLNTKSILNDNLGSYTVIVEISGCLSSVSEPFIISKTTIATFDKLTFYPNPASDILTFLNDSSHDIEVEILDSRGVKIIDTFKATPGKAYLPIQHLENGVYFLRFQVDSKLEELKKLIILKR